MDIERQITRKLLNSLYLYSYYHDKLLFQTHSFTSLPKPLVSWSLVYKNPTNLHHTFREPQQFIKIIPLFVHFCCTAQFMYFLRNSCHHTRMISYASLASRFMVSQRQYSVLCSTSTHIYLDRGVARPLRHPELFHMFNYFGFWDDLLNIICWSKHTLNYFL